MPPSKELRRRWLTIRVNDQEYTEIESHFKKTHCKKISDYARRVLLNKPVNVRYRNASVDDFLADMLALKKDLNGLANNFNQVVHKLHTLDRYPELRQWAQQNENDKEVLFDKINSILARVNQLHQLWLQS